MHLTPDEISRVPVLRDLLFDNDSGDGTVPLHAIHSTELTALLSLSRDPSHAVERGRVVYAIHAADYLGMEEIVPLLYSQLQCVAREFHLPELASLLLSNEP